MARKQGVVWSYIFMILEMLSSILFTPFLIRSFGQAEYGIYSLVLSITAYLALLDMGVGNAIVRYMAKFRVLKENDKQRNLLAVTVTFYAAVSVLVIIIGALLHDNMDLIFGKGLDQSQISRARQMFSITMLNMAFTLILAPFDKTIVAFEKFVFQKVLAIVKIIIRVGISIIVLVLGGKGVAIVVMNIVFTKDIGISMKAYYKGIFKGILPSIVIAMIMGIVIKILVPHSGWIGFMFICAVMVMVYAVSMYIKGFNQYEKQMVKSILNKVKHTTAKA